MQHLIPALHSDLIERRRLLDHLVDWRRARLIRIVAPAGFGKTTLAAWWLSEVVHTSSEAPPARGWITVDQDDTPPDVFLAQLLDALTAQFSAAHELAAMAAAGRISAEHCMAALSRRLAESTAPVILVVDDVQRLSAAALALLQPLLDAQLLPLTLVLLSRTLPALDDTTLQVRRQLLVIDAQQMRVDHEEFLTFIERTQPAMLGDQRLVELERNADGWFAALQLLLPTPGDARAIDHYLKQQVLRMHPPATVDFLAAVAFLPVLTAPLCATALAMPVDACTHLLRDAADADGLLQPFRINAQNSQTEAWRMHPLLRDALRHRIDHAAQDAARRRAAERLVAGGDVDAALGCLSAAQRRDAADLITPAVRPALLRLDLLSARRWLTTLAPELLAAHQQLALDAAWLEYFSDDTIALRAAIERARPIIDADAALTELRAELHTLDALCTWFEGDAERAHGIRSAAAEMPHAANGLAAGCLAMLDGYLPRDPSRAQLRIRALQRAADVFQRLGYAHGVAEAAAAQGFVKWRYANAEGAVASLTHALAVMRTSGWENSPAAGDAALACGEILYHMNRIDDARAMLQRARHAADAHGFPMATGILATLTLDLCSGAADHPDEDAWAYALRTYAPVVVGMIAALRILRDARRGRLERCWHTVESTRILPEDLLPQQPDTIWYAVLCGSICAGRADATVEDLVRQFRARMHAEYNEWMTLRADVLLVLCALAAGRADDALTQLTPLVAAVERSGMPRLLLDHAALHPLLQRCRLPFAQRLVREFDIAAQPERPFSLSPAEENILVLAVRGLTNDEIADRMFISRLTVYGHLRKCYAKMGVHTRAEAVRVAREAGIAVRKGEGEGRSSR